MGSIKEMSFTGYAYSYQLTDFNLPSDPRLPKVTARMHGLSTKDLVENDNAPIVRRRRKQERSRKTKREKAKDNDSDYNPEGYPLQSDH